MAYAHFVARPISQRLFSILQLTRMALVFTAISNSVCSTLLRAESNARANAGALRANAWFRARRRAPSGAVPGSFQAGSSGRNYEVDETVEGMV